MIPSVARSSLAYKHLLFRFRPFLNFKIYNWCMEIMSWSPGDNGRPMKPVKPEHVYFTDGEVAEYTNGGY